jgi:hypothetical protein
MKTSGPDGITRHPPGTPESPPSPALAPDRPAGYAPGMRRSIAPLALALFVLATASACSKAKDGGAAPGASAGAASPLAAVADFPKKEPSAWVNGAPFSLADAGGTVVLVEAWAPA